MSDDPNIPEDDRNVFSEFDDPVSDKDMVSKGIVWINANNSTIVERRTKSENDPCSLKWWQTMYSWWWRNTTRKSNTMQSPTKRSHLQCFFLERNSSSSNETFGKTKT